MEARFGNIWHDWHQYLVVWTRDRAPKLIFILVVAFILARLLGVITRRVLKWSERRSPGSALRAQQVRTLATVVRSTGVVLIVFFAAMAALRNGFDFDIGPLLASAGIVGIAIGFGAQTLVKDLINGFFILAENQFEIGDTVKTAGVAGKVEEITMRRTMLRDADGTLHLVPNGAIQIVSNMTRDWSQVTLHVAVDYGENSDRVVQLMKQVAEEFYADAGHQNDVVSAPEVPGIEAVRGQEVDYLMLIKVRPGRQYDVARELRRRIKTCFEQNKVKAGLPGQVFFGASMIGEKPQ